jgi:hypothetical protein
MSDKNTYDKMKEIFSTSDSNDEEINNNKFVVKDDLFDSIKETTTIIPEKKPTEEIPSIYDALNEYFKLKEQFEKVNTANKRQIMNNNTLSKKEKRIEYLKLQPKCVNCKRPSRLGTIFSIKYNSADDKTDEHRIYKVSCGNLANPCNLDIQINLGIYKLLEEEIRQLKKEINDYKYKIIDDKNKLLFGLITTENALENFETNKTFVSEITSIYENYLNLFINITNNQQKQTELNESLVILYENINKIKNCIKQMNENNDNKFASDAAEIYAKTVNPIMQKIRKLKYEVNMVHNDDNNKQCILIQKELSISSLLSCVTYDDNIVSYDIGVKSTAPIKPTAQTAMPIEPAKLVEVTTPTKTSKKKFIIIDSDE